MSDSTVPPGAQPPTLDVRVELRSAALPGGPLDSAGIDEVRRTVEGAIAAIARALGVPVSPLVTVAEVPIVGSDATDGAGPEPPTIAVHVDGRRCRFPEKAPWVAAAALSGHWPDRDPHSTSWRERTLPDCPIPSLVGAVCGEAVRLTPSSLLTPAAVRHYMAALLGAQPSLAASIAEATWLAEVLSEVLDLGISIGDVAGVARLLTELGPTSRRVAVETLVDDFRRDTVGLLISEDLWSELGTGDPTDDDDLRAVVERDVLDTTGIVTAPMVREDPSVLPPGTFALRVNELVGSPQLLLPPATCLVDDDGDLMSMMGVDARRVLDPVMNRPLVLVHDADREMLETLDLTTWTAPAYVSARLMTMLTHEGWRMVSQELTVALLDLQAESTPELVRAARSQLAQAELTWTLRSLAADGIPLRDLVPVLERVVDLPAAHLGQNAFAVLSDPVHGWAEPDGAWGPDGDLQFLRTGLRHQIAERNTTDPGVLVVYLLDGDLETVVRDPERSEADEDRVIGAIEAQIALLPTRTLTPVLLTRSDVRPPLLELLRHCHPELAVVAAEDLPAALAVQPVDRISWQKEAAR